MTGKHDRTGDIRRRKQRVEGVGAVLDCAHTGGSGIALSKSSPIVTAHTCETSNLRLNACPGGGSVPGPRLEHDRRGARASTGEKECAAADVDTFPGRPRRGLRKSHCCFLS